MPTTAGLAPGPARPVEGGSRRAAVGQCLQRASLKSGHIAVEVGCMSLLRAVARVLGARSGGFSVRQRLLGIVLVAALVFAAVAAVAALSSESVGRTAADERRTVALKETYLLFDALLGKMRGGVYEVVATETELASAKAGASREEAEEALEEYAEIRDEFEECGCRNPSGASRKVRCCGPRSPSPRRGQAALADC